MMAVCPDCGFENIQGADVCESCGQSLTALSKPQAHTPLSQSIIGEQIEKLTPVPPVTVAPDTPVGEVLNLMVDKHIGCVLVVEKDCLIGIFSERDALLRLNTEANNQRNEPISNFMTESPGTLEMHDKIAFAIHKMAVGGYRHVPIMAEGRPTGIISIRDILRYTTEKLHALEPAANQ